MPNNNNSNMSGGGNNPNAWGSGGGNNSNNNRNLDMPNLSALGINPGGNQQNQGSNMNNPPMGINLNALPMNPAIVAAALNQWGSAMGGLLNGMQNQGNNDQVRLSSTEFTSIVDCP